MTRAEYKQFNNSLLREIRYFKAEKSERAEVAVKQREKRLEDLQFEATEEYSADFFFELSEMSLDSKPADRDAVSREEINLRISIESMEKKIKEGDKTTHGS